MGIINTISSRLRGAVFALMGKYETISLNDERFWRTFGNARNGKLSEITYFTCLKTLSEAVAKLPLKMYSESKGQAVVQYTENQTEQEYDGNYILGYRGNCYVSLRQLFCVSAFQAQRRAGAVYFGQPLYENL